MVEIKSDLRILYTSDETHSPARFKSLKDNVSIVCIGDSITGWNNYGSIQTWPFKTYPEELQRILDQNNPAHQVLNAGMAGAVSSEGLSPLRRCLANYPNASKYIIGFGTNDLAQGDVELASARILKNLDSMIELVNQTAIPLVMNVPSVNYPLFPPTAVPELKSKRKYHNERLKRFCQRKEIPLIDIISCLHDFHFGDYIHPNAKGAEIIAQRVFDSIRAQEQS